MKDIRRDTRYELLLKVRYETKEAFGDAVIRNLSPGGLYLGTQTPFEVGARFQIEIDLAEDEDWLLAMCEVVWVNHVDTNSYPKGMGVKFLDMEPRFRSRLENYLMAM